MPIHAWTYNKGFVTLISFVTPQYEFSDDLQGSIFDWRPSHIHYIYMVSLLYESSDV